ncbi:DUF1183-domain-containing protein [Dendrothele bispora CBS 962.96]|uniref:Store-operated calcium entry-associated regulatory factor n=1 Tax=Dendrothele bispora (strain CBS 962.96) TaxID=1314807 RepID=A0A4S8MVP2_DENBC|nr:DUF1183-domain-containing protein [Dendrothele bispora CBS 962.96]
MSRVKLSNIKALTFYQDEQTAYRRTSPLPQLVCVGKPCKLFQPEVVRCTNLGGQGTDVDWKCEADLPEALRFGKVQVSCEGWSGPGDPYVLKDSCSLEYRLVEIPSGLRKSDSDFLNTKKDSDIFGRVFTIIWIAVLLFILYAFLKSCLQPRDHPSSGDQRPGGPGHSGSGWFPGNYDDDTSTDPPPPYTKHPNANQGYGGGQPWRPGFWTGTVMGGLADRFLFNRGRPMNDPPQHTSNPWTRRQYDWERPMSGTFARSSPRARTWSSDDRGEGPSNLGSMRQSSGFGGSAVR